MEYLTMFNHIYGIVGICGTLVALITSFMQDKELAQWIFVCSGWLAALFVGYFNYMFFKRLSLQLTNLIEKNNTISNELTNVEYQRKNIESIATYLASQNNPMRTTAIPRDN